MSALLVHGMGHTPFYLAALLSPSPDTNKRHPTKAGLMGGAGGRTYGGKVQPGARGETFRRSAVDENVSRSGSLLQELPSALSLHTNY